MKGQRWFANIVLLAAALGCAAAGAMAFGTAQDYHAGPARRLLFVGGPCLLALALSAGLRLPLEARVTLAVTLLSLVVAAYAAEWYLRQLPLLRVRWAARRFGIPYDSRDQFDVVRDLRAKGKDAWPAAFPAWQGLPLVESGLLPLGGISGVTTVLCNEMGQYTVFDSDEHGFHNPAGLWSSKALDIAVLGDSFTEGACVPSGQDFVSLIRAARPATLNLGMVGNGPMMMLAGLRELLVDLKPRIVIWMFAEGNDLTFDLHRERNYPFLTAYLEPGHRQGLLQKQAQVDTMLREVLERRFLARQEETMKTQVPSRFFKLWSLRQALGLSVVETNVRASQADLPLFRQVLENAKLTTQNWGGRLYVVYLPAEPRYFDARYRRDYDWMRNEVLAALRDLEIPVIDLDPAITKHADIEELYAHRGAHLGPAGYRMVADSILKALADPQGPAPANPAR